MSLATDTNGGLVAQARYEPYGKLRWDGNTVMPTEYAFTGQRLETDLGLYFYNARWYDPAAGRFIQADTIVPGGVQGLDRYAYSYNNPVKYIDPSGHKVCHWGDPEKACSSYADIEYQLDRKIEKPDEACYEDERCYRSYLTYKELVLQLHYIPSESEMLYMTIGSEYWQYVDMPYQGPSGYSPRSVGQEAVARQYYQFCGRDRCTPSEMYKFMSGYEQWAGSVNGGIGKQTDRAQNMAGILNNNFYGTGGQLAGDINQILNHELDSVAVQLGWIYGAQPNEPWQFFSGSMPRNISLGFGQNNYAILSVGESDYYLFMFTYYQTNNK